MANYYASARSNYFKVKDIEAFKEEFKDTEIEVIEENGKICMLFQEGIPDCLAGSDFEGEPLEREIDWAEIAKNHLVENQVMVLMESGAEKLRYIVGSAIAYSWTGESVQVSLNDIYALAQEEFGGDAEISKAEY